MKLTNERFADFVKNSLAVDDHSKHVKYTKTGKQFIEIP